jgi:hypothetical protein
MFFHLFNLDLHISVIADVKHEIPVEFSVQDWSISGHTFVFGRETDQVDVVNQHTWRGLNTEMRRVFFERYETDFAHFDGFISTHTPSFATLYEPWQKPVLIVNSCRYEQPFENNLVAWEDLNESLRRMNDQGLLIAVSNNKADQAYLELGTGIVSEHIPSLCRYTRSCYTGIHKEYVLQDQSQSLFSGMGQTRAMHELSQGPHVWQDLYNYRGIVHVPREISTMSIFEQYTANVPLFFPSKQYYRHLIETGQAYLQSGYSAWEFPPSLAPALDRSGNWFEFWIDRADFYDAENMPHIVYFDSPQHLEALLRHTDCQGVSCDMQTFNEQVRIPRIQKQWKQIGKRFK